MPELRLARTRSAYVVADPSSPRPYRDLTVPERVAVVDALDLAHEVDEDAPPPVRSSRLSEWIADLRWAVATHLDDALAALALVGFLGAGWLLALALS